METIQDFEDMLQFLDKHKVRNLIIGGLAFIYHAKPRYTKDMDLWIDPEPENVKRANCLSRSLLARLSLLRIPSFRIHYINRFAPVIIRNQLLHYPLTHVVHAFKSESSRVGG